jgi:hypothetical protein
VHLVRQLAVGREPVPYAAALARNPDNVRGLRVQDGEGEGEIEAAAANDSEIVILSLYLIRSRLGI